MANRKDKETQCRNATEHKRLVALIHEHNGNLSAMARELSDDEPITREGVAVRLRAHGLHADATAARAAACVTGQRVTVPRRLSVSRKERASILEEVARAKNYEEARLNLGLARRTFYRKLKQHGISSRAVGRHRARQARPEPTAAELNAVLAVVGEEDFAMTATEIATRLEIPQWDGIARCKAAHAKGLLARHGKSRYRPTTVTSI